MAQGTTWAFPILPSQCPASRGIVVSGYPSLRAKPLPGRLKCQANRLSAALSGSLSPFDLATLATLRGRIFWWQRRLGEAATVRHSSSQYPDLLGTPFSLPSLLGIWRVQGTDWYSVNILYYQGTCQFQVLTLLYVCTVLYIHTVLGSYWDLRSRR